MPTSSDSLATFFIPASSSLTRALLRRERENGLISIKNATCSMLLDGSSNKLIGVRIEHSANSNNKVYGSINNIKFFRDEGVFELEINAVRRRITAVPYCTLQAQIGRYMRFGRDRWPHGAVLGEVCSSLRAQIDHRYTKTRDDWKDVWASWRHQTRNVLSLFSDISPSQLLPNGKSQRGDGLWPKLAEGCKVHGLEDLVWSD